MVYRRTLAAVVCAALVACSSAAFGAGGIVVPGNDKNQKNQPKQEPLRLGLKFDQSKNVPGKSKIAVLFYFLDNYRATQQMVAYVNIDPKKNDPLETRVQTTVEHLKQGDIVTVELQKMDNLDCITKIDPLELKPGETTPHGYVFQESYNDPSGSGGGLVRLTKYGRFNSYEAALPFTKDSKNHVETDPDVAAAVNALKEGDPVYVSFVPMNSKTKMVNIIMPFKDSQTGKVAKVTEPTGEAAKTQGSEVEITTDDGKTVTAQVPGKTINKRFVPDPILKNTVHTLKKDNEVIFLTRTVGDKEMFVELTKAPPAPKGKSTGSDKSEKMDKTDSSKKQ